MQGDPIFQIAYEISLLPTFHCIARLLEWTCLLPSHTPLYRNGLLQIAELMSGGKKNVTFRYLLSMLAEINLAKQ